MKNIIDDIKSYIERSVTLIASPLYIDQIPTAEGDAVMIRANPGQPVEVRYFDSSRTGAFPFSIYARSNDSGKAYNQLCDLMPILDMKGVQLTAETMVSIEPTSNPSLVLKTEAGEYTYIAGFQLDYHIGG